MMIFIGIVKVCFILNKLFKNKIFKLYFIVFLFGVIVVFWDLLFILLWNI